MQQVLGKLTPQQLIDEDRMPTAWSQGMPELSRTELTEMQVG
jgi:hypothetical protein